MVVIIIWGICRKRHGKGGRVCQASVCNNHGEYLAKGMVKEAGYVRQVVVLTMGNTRNRQGKGGRVCQASGCNNHGEYPQGMVKEAGCQASGCNNHMGNMPHKAWSRRHGMSGKWL